MLLVSWRKEDIQCFVSVILRTVNQKTLMGSSIYLLDNHRSSFLSGITLKDMLYLFHTMYYWVSVYRLCLVSTTIPDLITGGPMIWLYIGILGLLMLKYGMLIGC